MTTATERVARLLRQFTTADVMHPDVICCPHGASLLTVARMMATYRVHAIVVLADESDGLANGAIRGVIADTDLLQAALAPDFDLETARSLAATAPLTIAGDEPLEGAVQLMVENEVTHLIVVERDSRRPIGVVSTLDVARALAG